MEGMRSRWLPALRDMLAQSSTTMAPRPRTPIMLVGNKIDLRGQMVQNLELERQMTPLMEEFKEVEMCIECSAKANLNINETFYFATQLVLYPTAPVYDSTNKRMKDECVAALRRIFKLSDKDKDGVLNDLELNQFQARCFGAPLQPEELEGVKNVVRENIGDGITSDGLTCVGFLFLQHFFIQQGLLGTTWTVLRTFGYDNSLSLRSSFLSPEVPWSEDDTCMLTHKGYTFFANMFERSDLDNDGALNKAELKDVFATCPNSAMPSQWAANHFPTETTHTDSNGNVTLQGWLAQWSMTTLLDFRTTLRYLALMGYEEDLIHAVCPVAHASSLQHDCPRTMRGLVLGAPSSGKSTFLERYLGKSCTTATPQVAKMVVNQVDGNQVPSSSSIYLVLEEANNADEEQAALERLKQQNTGKVGQQHHYDVVCFFFNGSGSIKRSGDDPSQPQKLFALHQRVLAGCAAAAIPCLHFITDVSSSSSSSGEEIRSLFEEKQLRYLPPPIPLSLKHDSLDQVFLQVANEALNRKTSVYVPKAASSLRWGMIAAGGVVVAAIVAAAYAWRSHSASPKPSS
ncbi:ERMES complex Ca(2+)-binding regulatory GTPase gem1 [Balamuthia mandrillaris]